MVNDTPLSNCIKPSIDADLTILMPCLNEAATVGACVNEAMAFLRSHKIYGEVLICDNGCTDDSAMIAQKCGARVVFCPQKGYGNALRCGLENARGKIIIMGDCDLSYDFSQIQQMYELLLQGADLVIGNRFAYGPPSSDAMPLLHRTGVPLLSLAGRIRFRCNVMDFHCGLRGIRKDALEKLQFNTTGMEFATEMIALASKNAMVIQQTPVILRPDGRVGKSNLRTFRDGFRHLWYILTGKSIPES